MDAKNTSTAELARLNWRLGRVYADTIESAALEVGVKPQLIACHGQTIYHQSTATSYAGKPVRCTWQTGEPAVIAERMRVPVVSDFVRPIWRPVDKRPRWYPCLTTVPFAM